MKTYDVVLFDLDGTLTDPGLGITKSVEYALNHYGITVKDRRELEHFIGPPLIDSFMGSYGFSKEQATEAVEVYREYFSVTGLFENEVYPHIPELLNALKKAGKILLVASSKPEVFVLRILEHFDLLRFFDGVGGAAMDESRTNKADVVEYILGKAGVTDRSRCILVGDRKFDVNGAHEAGMDALAVTYGYGSLEELTAAQPEHIAHTPKDIERILL